jgi:hypothetical protein
MKIKKILLNNVDDSGSRAISIKTSEGTIETPTRSLSNSELMKLKGIRNESEIPVSPFEAAEELFPWKIYESTLQYNRKIIGNMLNSKKGISDKKSNINSKISPINKLLGEGESKNLLKIIYPKIGATEEYSLMELQILADIQRLSNVDIIVLPETKANCNIDEFKNTINYISSFLEDVGNTKPIMPTIHINCSFNNFENKIDYLYDNNFMMSGIICHTYHGHAGLHILRSKAREFENFWIHGFGAYRNRRNNQLYNPHAAQIWGIDSVGMGSQGGGYPNQNNNEENSSKEIPLNNEILRGYNSQDWGIHRVKADQIDTLLCDCEGCKYYNNSNIIKQNALDVHEAFKSFEQDELARKMILEDSYKELLKGKKQIKKYYESEIEDLSQSKLNGF